MTREQQTSEEAALAEPVESPRSAAPAPAKSNLIRECWADLRGRPRPTTPPPPKQERPPIAESKGFSYSEADLRRLEERYGSTHHSG